MSGPGIPGPSGPGGCQEPPVPAAWVTAGIEAAIAHHKRQRDGYWNCPSSGEVAAVIADVRPRIAAAERERVDALKAEVRQVIATFLAVRGGGQGARDLAEAIRQVLDREPLGTQGRGDTEAGRG